MPRYIDADKLGIGYANPDIFKSKGYADGWNSAITLIKNAPTENVQEVKHGYWMIREFGDDAQCSECKHKFPDVYDIENSDRYCRVCGAEMKGLKVIGHGLY